MSVLENGIEDVPLFNGKLVTSLDWQDSRSKFQPPISPSFPGENLLMRPLQLNDYDTGFLELLGQLTKVDEVTREEFVARFRSMKACKDTYYVTVIEDTMTGQVIGAATLLAEQKFIHKCALKGHLEDVVVSDVYRGKQLGKLLVETMTQLAKQLGMYKISLTCKDHMTKFYEQFGYSCEPGNSTLMIIRFRK